MPLAAVKEATMRIGNVLQAERVLGFVSVTFCAFFDPTSRSAKLAANELSLGPSLAHLTYNMFTTLVSGATDEETGQCIVASADQNERETKRCFVALNHVYHPGLAQVSATKLFRSCRQRHLSFNLAGTKGLAFLLNDKLIAGMTLT